MMASRYPQYPPRRTSARMHLFYGIVFTIAAVGTWLLLNMGNIEELTETWNRRDAEREQIEDLKERIKKLKKQQQSLAFNGMESERLLRERKGMVVPGETVIYFHEAGTTSSAITKAQETTAPIRQKIEN